MLVKLNMYFLSVTVHQTAQEADIVIRRSPSPGEGRDGTAIVDVCSSTTRHECITDSQLAPSVQ